MNKKIINDNKKITRELISKVYDHILKLDTKTLTQHELTIFKELISRKDYNELDFLIEKYYIIRYELLRRGVNLND